MDKTIWGIHAGKTGDADSLFKKNSCIAIGWNKVGDLTKLRPDREDYKSKERKCQAQFRDR